MSKITSGGRWLSQHYRANDYYSEKESIEGFWLGRLAPEAGLVSGAPVREEDFLSVMAGRHPGDGGKLRQREHGKVQGFDFQCSAQKSVSVMALVGGDERLQHAHREAVKTAFGELERLAGHRAGDSFNKHVETTGRVLASVWHHDASRALDPQLHTHLCVVNFTVGADGRRYGLTEEHMVRAVRYAGKVYQNELRRNVERLGYETETKRGTRGQIEGFEIKGVPAEVCQRFSRRRAEIEREAKVFEREHGREPTAAELHVIAKETRADKLTETTTGEMRAAQRAMLSPGELESINSLRASAFERGDVSRRVDTRELLSSVRRHLEERHAVFPEHQLLAEALNRGMGRTDLPELKRAVKAARELVRLDDPGARRGLMAEMTTTLHLKLERESILMVSRGIGSRQPLNSGFEAWADGRREGERWLDASGREVTGQKRAVEEMLRSPDFVHALRGVAGAGKTTALKEFAKGVEAAGKELVMLAPTAAAVKVLEEEGFTGARTLAAFLQKPPPLHRNTVLAVDEAGFLSNRQGRDLLKLAKESGAAVRLIGDTRQLTGVQAGDWLRTLETFSKMKSSELTDIRRQTDARYREATKLMSAGDTRGGLERLDALGWVHESPDYLKAAAFDWLQRTGGGRAMTAEDGKAACLGLAPTHAENRVFTAEVREELIKNGVLGEEARMVPVFEPFDTTPSQRRDVREYEPGMAVTLSHGRVRGIKDTSLYTVTGRDESKHTVTLQDEAGKKVAVNVKRDGEFLEPGRTGTIEIRAGERLRIGKNRHKDGLVNGQTVTVAGFTKDGRIEFGDGKGMPEGFLRFTHGYAVTAASAQGATAKTAVAFGGRFRANEMYVAASRATDSMTLHVPDKSAMFESVARNSGMRKSASEGLAAREAALAARRTRHRQALIDSARTARKLQRTRAKERAISLRLAGPAALVLKRTGQRITAAVAGLCRAALESVRGPAKSLSLRPEAPEPARHSARIRR